jgi:branched-chain amino acid transport system permease protein
METSVLLYAVFSGITNGFVYGFIGLGMSAIFRGTGIINAMQGEFCVLAALTTAALTVAGLPLVAAIGVALAISVVIAVLIERVLIVPLVRRGASPESFLLLTLALALLSSATLLFVFGREARFLPGIGGTESIRVLDASVRVHALAVIGIVVVLTVALRLFFTKTVFGLEMVASALDARGAATTGINVARTRTATFVLGGLLGAIAGILIAPLTPLGYLSGTILTLKGFAAAVLGGLHHPMGAIVGGIVFGLIESLAVLALPSGYKELVAYAALIAVLILLPRGLIVQRGVRHGG